MLNGAFTPGSAGNGAAPGGSHLFTEGYWAYYEICDALNSGTEIFNNGLNQGDHFVSGKSGECWGGNEGGGFERDGCGGFRGRGVCGLS